VTAFSTGTVAGQTTSDLNAARQGYAESTAFLHRKNAGQLYFSNISSVNFSRFARMFHLTTDNKNTFNLDLKNY